MEWLFYTISYYLNIISATILWVIGVLGNVINLIVFNQKEMSQSPVNLIFWWLSLGDLLELLTIVSYEFNCDWCLKIDPSSLLVVGLPMFLSSYILFALHTFSVVLNITLAIKRFNVVRKPVHNKSSSNRQSLQRMVIGLFIFSFGTSLSVLYKLFILTSRGRQWTMKILWTQLFETFFRLGCLIGLIIAGTMLIFAVVRARNAREHTFDSEEITKSGRKMAQINELVVIIVLMFIVSDIVMIVDGVITLLMAICHIMNIRYKYCQTFYSDFKAEIMSIQLPAILVNCSYSIFCYLLFSSQYRETLRGYLSNKNIHVLSKLMRRNPENIVNV